MKTALGRVGSSSLDFPIRIAIDSESHPQFTVVELTAPDRLGLLHDLLRAISDADFEISAARVATEKGAAMDTFFVGRKVGAECDKQMTVTKPTDPAELDRLRAALIRAAAGQPA